MATIFVLDDDRDITYILDYWLSSQGFTVKYSNTAEELLSALEQEIPDILLLDVLLNDSNTNGLILSKIVKEKSESPVFLLTALPISITELKLSEADGVIEKPFDLHEVYLFLSNEVNKKIK